MEAPPGPAGTAAAPLLPRDPRAVGPYRLTGRLGQGGMGVVYLGHAPDGTAVAVKVVRPHLAEDPTFRARFRTEASAAARVVGFCTAPVLDGDVEADAPYIVTEYVPGLSLEDAVVQRGPLPPREVDGFAAGVAMALAAIHRAGIVHRDLKPANVILSPSGPRVIDFGIARPQEMVTGHTQTGELVGSPGWIAPEQLRGEPVTPAVDVFAWGGLVLFAATGRRPFGEGPPAAVAYRVLSSPPDPWAMARLADLAPRVHRLALRALQPRPAERPGAEALLSALLDSVADPSLGAGLPPPPAPSPTTRVLPAAAPTAVDQVSGAGATAPASQGPAPPPLTTAHQVPGPPYRPPSAPAPSARPGAAPPQPPPVAGSATGTVRPRRRRLLVGAGLAVAALVVGGALRDAQAPGRSADRATPSASATPGSTAPAPRSTAPATPRASRTPAPTSGPVRTVPRGVRVAGGTVVAGRLRPVRDSDVVFAVQQVVCGVRRIGAYRTPAGQMCLVDVLIRNDGRRGHFLPNQRLYTAEGGEFGSNAFLAGPLRQGPIQWTTIGPGQTLSGTLVFELPARARPEELDFRADLLNSGSRRDVP